MLVPSSVAEPRPHPLVGSQLVRRWRAEGTPWAEVVLVHGLAEHSGRYEQVGSQMAAAGLNVTSFDLVGFGLTGGRRGHVADWAHFLDQVEEMVVEAKESGRPVALAGFSLGGLIALEYALAERPAPDVLVLTAPALGGGESWHRLVLPALARVAGRVRLPNYWKGHHLSRNPAVGEAYYSDPLVLTKSSCHLGHLALLAIDRTRRACAGLTLPTLVLHGGQDAIVPPTSSVELGELAVVERRLYPDLRHELANEPEGPAVIAEIIEWVKAKIGP